MVTNLMKLSVLCLISLTGAVLLVIGKKENVTKFEDVLDDQFPDVSEIQRPFSKCTILKQDHQS